MVTFVHAGMGGGGGFYFNLSADVGQGCKNNQQDVELVRFGYYCYRMLPLNAATINKSAEFKTALQTMQTRGPYGKDLQDVIDLHQVVRASRDGVLAAADGVDGKVSTLKMTATSHGTYTTGYFAPGGTYNYRVLEDLNESMVGFRPRLFPRIDLDPMCGSELKSRVRFMLLWAGDVPDETLDA